MNPSIPLGTTEQFTATGTFSDGSTQDVTKSAAWSSTAPNVATVSTTGLATSVAQGASVISAASGSIAGSSVLNVAVPALTSLAVAQVLDRHISTFLPVGSNRQFTATGTYTDSSTKYLTQAVTWASANTAIATVTPMGLVTAVSPGTVNITVSLGGVTSLSPLVVVAQHLSGMVVTPVGLSLQVGMTQQFNSTGEYNNATIRDFTTTAKWASSTTNVATVSSTGLVTAVSPGKATISATSSATNGSSTITVTSTAPPNVGQWSAPHSLGMLAIHAALLNTGKVLFFGYPIGRSGGPSPARLYDPIANTVTDVTLPFPIDIFCSGLSFLPDGRLLVSGGLNDALNAISPSQAGTYDTTLFDPGTNTWSQGPPMIYARWYPTTVPMPDGTILALSGDDATGKRIQSPMESYDPVTNTWTALPPSANMPNLAAKGLDTGLLLYPLMTLLASGKLFDSGSRQDSQLFDPSTNSWSFVANMNVGPRGHAAAALLPDSQTVLIVGGARGTANGGSNPTNAVEIIDLSQPAPKWAYTGAMSIPRYNMNLLYLADGTLLAVGGNQSGHYGLPVEVPELYNPAIGLWTEMAAQVGQRGYHSTALLLPDGRVISAGSDSGTPLQNTYEIYSPPYLYNGTRPAIASAPSSISYGQAFAITTPDAANISRVALIRPSATTHANHFDDQRYVDLTWSSGSGELTATAPASPNDAPPGYYMLVILNSNGVPSVMPFLQLQSNSGAGAPATNQ